MGNSGATPKGKLTKEEQTYIQEVAKDFFDNLPHDKRLQIQSIFRGIDEDGDGKLSLLEILHSPLSTEFGPNFALRATQLFSFLDMDGSGSLDPKEFITFIFLSCVEVPTCHHCSRLLTRPGYTCQTCKSEGGSYHLCLPCYFSKFFTHHHDNLVHAYVLDGYIKKTSMEEISKEVQCMVCGDYHSKNVKSILDTDCQHISKMVELEGKYICEYCRFFFCSNCQKFIEGTSKNAEPSQCIDGTNACTNCGIPKPWTFDLEKFHQMVGNEEELMKKCNTCKIKVTNGTLLREKKLVEMDTGMTQMGSNQNISSDTQIQIMQNQMLREQQQRFIEWQIESSKRFAKSMHDLV